MDAKTRKAMEKLMKELNLGGLVGDVHREGAELLRRCGELVQRLQLAASARRRRYYRITPAGRQALATEAQRMRQLADAVEAGLRGV